mgnify:CR=1 FL=1
MGNILFCRIGWMKWYQGLLEQDPIHGGGAYVDYYGYGHEIYNFSHDDQGNLYGFVEVGGNLWLERLGAEWYQPSVYNVQVVWCSRPTYGFEMYIVGWYGNATVFRESQPCPPQLVGKRPLPRIDDKWTYRVIGKQSESVLLPEDERTFVVPRATSTSGGFGRSNIWYADYASDADFRRKVLNYITTREKQIPEIVRRESAGVVRYQPDIEKRQKVEQLAMDSAQAWYREHGWVTEDVSDRNRGWDIEAKLDDRLLRIEVKGLSGETIAFELTPREYEAMKRFSPQGLYNVCVVTNALSEERELHHFTYRTEANELFDTNNGIRLQMQDKIAARITVIN